MQTPDDVVSKDLLPFPFDVLPFLNSGLLPIQSAIFWFVCSALSEWHLPSKGERRVCFMSNRDPPTPEQTKQLYRLVKKNSIYQIILLVSEIWVLSAYPAYVDKHFISILHDGIQDTMYHKFVSWPDVWPESVICIMTFIRVPLGGRTGGGRAVGKWGQWRGNYHRRLYRSYQKRQYYLIILANRH